MTICKFVFGACVCAFRNGVGFCTDFRSPLILGPSATMHVMQVVGTPQGRLSSLADSLWYTSRLRIGIGRSFKEVRDGRANIFWLPVVALHVIQFLLDELDRKHRKFCFGCSSSVCASIPSTWLVRIRVIWISFRHTHKKTCKHKSHLKHQHLLRSSRF